MLEPVERRHGDGAKKLKEAFQGALFGNGTVTYAINLMKVMPRRGSKMRKPSVGWPEASTRRSTTLGHHARGVVAVWIL